ncbi:MAG TPA: UvrB/UvrC motif-containing protein [Planctomycetota bacterium]|nr:UvrB/UvrC motif-containing protein [Planctomycetota bacterium]HRR81884.1 UvrB/UvrC motif-containing protein [Planctomycetota bacterium]HRT95649.1 UvrB/UvrC motif-containing protein [Planctomycetota bacterium]
MSQIVCQCGKKLATIHVTEIINGEKKEIHLCEDCAKKKKLVFPAASSVIDLSEVLSGIVQAADEADSDELQKAVCPDCGITFADFRTHGRFGCPTDYEAFRKGVDPLLERIHGTAEHRGKRMKPRAARSRDTRLVELRAQLRQAVADEAFERAARIRDQIYALKKEQGHAAD